MLRLIERPEPETVVRFAPSSEAVVSWNADAAAGELALTVHRVDGTVSAPLPYARWSQEERRSLAGGDERTRIEVDVLRGDVPFDAIAVSSTVPLDVLAVATPAGAAEGNVARCSGTQEPHQDERLEDLRSPAELDVPRLSQYLAEFPQERGWCSAASLAMLVRYHRLDADVPSVARAVYDAAYRGTGNWAFTVAYAGARGLRAVVAYLRGIDHALRFVAAGLPVAISIGWEPGELPGAPVEHSAGHLLVVRGADEDFVSVNDPAHPDVATRYPRAALDRLFRSHGGVAYLIAPRQRTDELVALANATELATTR